jgi:hypothetical protein
LAVALDQAGRAKSTVDHTPWRGANLLQLPANKSL